MEAPRDLPPSLVLRQSFTSIADFLAEQKMYLRMRLCCAKDVLRKSEQEVQIPMPTSTDWDELSALQQDAGESPIDRDRDTFGYCAKVSYGIGNDKLWEREEPGKRRKAA